MRAPARKTVVRALARQGFPRATKRTRVWRTEAYRNRSPIVPRSQQKTFYRDRGCLAVCRDRHLIYVATGLGASVAIVFPVATHRPGLRAQ